MLVLFDPPPVPTSQAVSVHNTRDPSLLWVHAGTAEVRAAQQEYLLSSGQGIWLPAGIPYTVEVGADSVAFPIFPAAGTRAPNLDRPQRINLSNSWSEWLIYQFARSIGYLRGATSDTSLLDLVAGSRYATPKEEARPIEQVPLPPMPRSPEALTVAHSLLQRPDDPSETTDH
ncbi:AraC family transcriptional regulator, partial [Brachybacterium alimentarium]